MISFYFLKSDPGHPRSWQKWHMYDAISGHVGTQHIDEYAVTLYCHMGKIIVNRKPHWLKQEVSYRQSQQKAMAAKVKVRWASRGSPTHVHPESIRCVPWWKGPSPSCRWPWRGVTTMTVVMIDEESVHTSATSFRSSSDCTDFPLQRPYIVAEQMGEQRETGVCWSCHIKAVSHWWPGGLGSWHRIMCHCKDGVVGPVIRIVLKPNISFCQN